MVVIIYTNRGEIVLITNQVYFQLASISLMDFLDTLQKDKEVHLNNRINFHFKTVIVNHYKSLIHLKLTLISLKICLFNTCSIYQINE